MGAESVLVTGGCGYVGSRLVPALLDAGFRVRVIDSLIFGNHLPEEARSSPALEVHRADIRDRDAVRDAVRGMEAVVHLAALANDPSADLDPQVTREVNRDSVFTLIEEARRAGVRRFVNASTATVYGVRDEIDVDETFDHRPITLYGEYKSETDRAVREADEEGFRTVCLRAATVCGWSPRMRLDLTVNLLTYQAICNGLITVFGGTQMRPNIVIDDLVRAYMLLLSAPAEKVGGQAFNVGSENQRVLDIARLVAGALDKEVEVVVEPIFDARSYHVSSAKIRRDLGFEPAFGIREGARQVAAAFARGAIPHPETSIYRNVQHMKSAGVAVASR